MEYSELIPWGIIAIMAVGGHIYESFYGGGDINGRNFHNDINPSKEEKPKDKSLESEVKTK